MAATQPSRALVVKLSSLGDLFHALPAVHLLKRALHLEVDWITQPEYKELVGCFGCVDRVLTFPRRSLWRSGAAWILALRQNRYDYIFDFQGLLKSAMVARLARGRQRIGPSYHREGARWLYRAVAGPADLDRHAVEQALDTVRFMNVTVEDTVFEVSFPKQLLNAERPRIAYLPSSRWPTKNWPPAYFAETIQHVDERVGGTSFLLGAPADGAVADLIVKSAASTKLVNLVGRTDLIGLGSYLQEMDLVVSVDSGPMHMAAALGIPTVAIFGPTNAIRTGPYGDRHTVLQTSHLTCVPCLSRACLRPERDHACMKRLVPVQVIEAVVSKL